MKQNKYYSYILNSLCNGCKLCVQGRKSVIFITGLCPRRCYYCPLSDKKRFKDVMYANERQVQRISEIIDEVKTSKSVGAGITGGDPLLKLDRTVDTIKALKKTFGKKFHIHLYTSLILANEKSLKLLYDAGLDEIRFHPDIEDNKDWSKIAIAKKFNWKIGVEIPVIPGFLDKTWSLITAVKPFIDFLNINELEISDTNGNFLNEKGFVCKDDVSYAIKGSNELALKLLGKIKKEFPSLCVHYCTSKLKDGVQLANRLKIRAESIKKKYDLVTKEGMIVRGFIVARESYIGNLSRKFDIPRFLLEYDPLRKQILIASWVLMEISSDVKYKCGIVTEYPTFDRLIVDLQYLN